MAKFVKPVKPVCDVLLDLVSSPDESRVWLIKSLRVTASKGTQKRDIRDHCSRNGLVLQDDKLFRDSDTNNPYGFCHRPKAA